MTIMHQNLEWSSISAEILGQSQFPTISQFHMGCIRLAITLMIWITCIFLYIDSEGIKFAVLQRDGSKKNLHIVHGDRFIFFTVWSWIMQVRVLCDVF